MLKLLTRMLAVVAAAIVAGALFVAAMTVWSWLEPTPDPAAPLPPGRSLGPPPQ